MELLCDVGHVESRSVRLEMVFVLVQDRCTVSAEHTIGTENHFGRTRWFSYVTKLNWKLVLVRLEILLILTQDRCTISAERTIGLEIVLDAPNGTPW